MRGEIVTGEALRDALALLGVKLPLRVDDAGVITDVPRQECLPSP
jgi:hypothetical protein